MISVPLYALDTTVIIILKSKSNTLNSGQFFLTHYLRTYTVVPLSLGRYVPNPQWMLKTLSSTEASTFYVFSYAHTRMIRFNYEIGTVRD